MSEPFIAEISIFAGDFAPKGWEFCNGQLLPINQNQALFSLLGTSYGGDSKNTFALPDLRSRAPVHAGTGPGLPEVALGQAGGSVPKDDGGATSYTRARISA
jgi:microcystin-dependent protein